MKAKKASLISKIIGAAVVVAGNAVLFYLVAAGKITADEMKALSPVVNGAGLCVMGMFGTVDLNLLAEKFSVNKEQ